MRKVALLLALIFAAVPELLYAEQFPSIPNLSKFAVHAVCAPGDATDLSVRADFYRLYAGHEVYTQTSVYIFRFEETKTTLRAEIVEGFFGILRRAFVQNNNENQKEISPVEYGRIFNHGMRNYLSDSGEFDSTKFSCRPAQDT